MESKFKVGDLVRVTKPEYPLAYKDTPGWVDEMDIVIGREVRISGIPGEKWVEIMIAGDEWTFHSDWCDLVTEESKVEANTEKLEVGNKTIIAKKESIDSIAIRLAQLRKWASQWEATTSGVDDPLVAASSIPYFFYDPDWCTAVDSRPKLSSESISECPVQPKMRVYIAGKISGLCQSDVNRTFGEAAEKLRKWGFEPISPIEHGGENKTWAEYMLTLLPILHDCQGIYLLDNWDDSDGAKVEKLFAKKDGMFLIREVR